MALHDARTVDLVLINGRILTMDAHDTVAQAVAVRDEKIVAVGSDSEIEPLAGASTQAIDLDARIAMPGLTDCHVHVASDSSRAVESVECRDLYDSRMDSVVAIVARLKEWAASTPPGQWIVARGSPLADFRLKERRLPTRADLDAAAPRHPTYLSFGAHVIIANTLALRERGVTRDTPSPQGGTVEEGKKPPPQGPPFRIRNTRPLGVYGLPSVSVPCGFSKGGLPIGLQISGPPFGEAQVLALAHAYEQATEWHKRRPDLS